MKQAVAALAHGGKYSATTFNLAFYLSTLLKKEMEAEALERDKESKLNLAPYLEAPKPAVAAAPYGPTPAPAFIAAAAEEEEKPKSRMPLAIAAAVTLAVLGGGAYMFLARNGGVTPATTTAATAQMLPTPGGAPAQKAPVLPEPIVVASTSTAPAAATDAEAQKKAFEDAVKAKMQAEMMKLQNDYMEQLKKQQSKNAPVVATPAPAPTQVADERPSISAAQLDQQRRETARPDDTPAPAPVQQTQSAAPQVVQPSVATPAPAPVQTATVREGDVVEMAALDAVPHPTRPITPMYPAIARQQKIAATIVVTALINERGEVSDVKVLRGVNRFGIDEAALRAMRSARFTPPMKDGKRVKTWMPQTIEFRP
jgi:TonB family protein